MTALLSIFCIIDVDISAVILFSKKSFAEANSSTPVSPILPSAEIEVGLINFFPKAAPAIILEKDTGYNPTSRIDPPARLLLKSR